MEEILWYYSIGPGGKTINCYPLEVKVIIKDFEIFSLDYIGL
jgi:hypothetical protein